MIRLNVHEAKTHLSRYLDQVEQGETVVLCRHNRPIAEIRRIEASPVQSRTLGTDRGKFMVGKEFFDPLPPALMAFFDGTRD